MKIYKKKIDLFIPTRDYRMFATVSKQNNIFDT